MLVHFTVSSVLPRVTGSTAGMGLALAEAFEAARAADAPIGNKVHGLDALIARNVIALPYGGRLPVGGAALLDILV